MIVDAVISGGGGVLILVSVFFLTLSFLEGLSGCAFVFHLI